MLVRGPGRRLREWFCGLRGVWVVLVPILPLMLYANVVFPRFPYINHTLIDDWYAHALYGTLFFYGFLIGRDEGFWTELRRMRAVLLGLGVVAFVALLAVREFIADDPGFILDNLRSAVIYLNRWTWIMAMFAWGHHLIRGPVPGLSYATKAVYPWYILHQTITVVVGYELSKLALGPVVEPILVLGATIGGCLLLYEYVIRRVPPLRPLFGLTYRDRTPAQVSDSRYSASRNTGVHSAL